MECRRTVSAVNRGNRAAARAIRFRGPRPSYWKDLSTDVYPSLFLRTIVRLGFVSHKYQYSRLQLVVVNPKPFPARERADYLAIATKCQSVFFVAPSEIQLAWMPISSSYAE
jgi:hypothetical protein